MAPRRVLRKIKGRRKRMAPAFTASRHLQQRRARLRRHHSTFRHSLQHDRKNMTMVVGAIFGMPSVVFHTALVHSHHCSA
ncbi:hypothetical protein M405DRAFT_275002 [Rhizopogon salebrosus TDB-379]|nr:hypothetical protein M405DRAFT_275002 [Rhizopogon salebrosus TDB-379]